MQSPINVFMTNQCIKVETCLKQMHDIAVAKLFHNLHNCRLIVLLDTTYIVYIYKSHQITPNSDINKTKSKILTVLM